MADIRQTITDDQGLLRKLQNYIPGFRGYRRDENIRDADNFLRIQLANHLSALAKDANTARETLANNYDIQNIEKVGSVIFKLQALEPKVRHAEGGYSAMTTTLNVSEAELNRLYEFDLSLFSFLAGLKEAINGIITASESGNSSDVSVKTRDALRLLGEFEATFNRRIVVMKNIEQ